MCVCVFDHSCVKWIRSNAFIDHVLTRLTHKTQTEIWQTKPPIKLFNAWDFTHTHTTEPKQKNKTKKRKRTIHVSDIFPPSRLAHCQRGLDLHYNNDKSLTVNWPVLFFRVLMLMMCDQRKRTKRKLVSEIGWYRFFSASPVFVSLDLFFLWTFCWLNDVFDYVGCLGQAHVSQHEKLISDLGHLMIRNFYQLGEIISLKAKLRRAWSGVFLGGGWGLSVSKHGA